MGARVAPHTGGHRGHTAPPIPPPKSLDARASAPPNTVRAQRGLHFAARGGFCRVVPATHTPAPGRLAAANRSPANNAGRQHQTGCPQHRHEWLASHQTTAPQQLQSLEPRGTCRGEPPKRTRGSDLFLPVDDLQRSLASVQNLRNGAATAHQAGFCSPQQNIGRSRFPGP